MKISYDNILKTATLTATNQSDNNPVANIVHNYLELPYDAIENDTVITAEFTEDQSINHIAYGFHNLSLMHLYFFDALNNPIDDFSITVGPDEQIYYFPSTITGVGKIEIELTTAADTLYIGCIFMGIYLQMPNFSMALPTGIEIRDSVFQSGSGQSGGNRQRNLETQSPVFQNVDNDKKNEIKLYLKIVQRSIPHFIDFYPDAHEYFPIIYGKVTSNNPAIPKRRINTWKWDISISYKESR